MVVVLLLLAGMAVLGAWCVLLALVGRSTVPRRERLPLRAWSLADLRANAVRGASSLVEADRAAYLGPGSEGRR